MPTLPDQQREASSIRDARAVSRARLRTPVEISWTRLVLATDLAMLGIATALDLLISATTEASTAPIPWLVAFPVLVLARFRARGTYSPRLRLQILDDLRNVVSTTAIVAMAILTTRAVLVDDPSIAGQTVVQWLAAATLLGAGRVVLYLAQRQGWKRGDWMRPTLIVGAGNVGHGVARRLLDYPECGLKPVGFLDKEPLAGTSGLPVLGASWDFEEVVREYRVRHVIVTFSKAPHDVLLGILRRCDELGVTVSLVPRLFERVTERLRVEHLGGLPLLTIHRADPKGWQFELKYACDRLVATLGLLVVAPILLLAAAVVALTMGRPILYRQQRVGLDGKTFAIVKFRSMRLAPVDHLATPENQDERARLTRLGAFLRATSIDELPQLVNLLRGEMSLIGPRPERPEFAEIFEQYVYRYGDRLRVKSGITGWAQVHGIGRGHDRFSREALSDRVEWDNYYIENWSLWLDLKILLMTVTAVLTIRQR